MTFLGEYDLGETINFRFSTHDGTGAPATLAGGPAISVYKDASGVQSTAGITLTVDQDWTGMHLVTLTLVTDLVFYSDGSDFDLVITVGTVGGISVVGYVIGRFRIKRAKGQGVIRQSTAQVSAVATVVLDAGASANNGAYVGYFITIVKGTGAGQLPRAITAYVGATKTATVTPSWTTAPDATSEFAIFA